jgi:hypothetical protein
MTDTDDPITTAQDEEVVGETSRDAWLEVALNDVDGCAAALATAARHGRPLPPLERS